MKFSLVVLGAPYASESGYSALRFATAAVAAGHQIYRVFFYGDGVYCAQLGQPPYEGAPDLVAGWQALIKKQAIELGICVGSASRRGILDEHTATQQDRQSAALCASGFQILGLGQLIDASLQSDRLVTFGA